ncbi:hypothetical protein GCM10009802_47640 [Streptomyces synnematoformans]|uniref:Transposase n=1 Tax=Streptomyces synnematoformans TaxID=415721 RepID=A0ABP5L2V1_9ACTN
MEGVRPSSWAAPSIWYAAVAVPHRKPSGKVAVVSDIWERSQSRQVANVVDNGGRSGRPGFGRCPARTAVG